MHQNELPPVTTGPTGEQLKAFIGQYESVVKGWSDELVNPVTTGLNEDEVMRFVDAIATKAGGNLDAVTPEILEEVKKNAQGRVYAKNSTARDI